MVFQSQNNKTQHQPNHIHNQACKTSTNLIIFYDFTELVAENWVRSIIMEKCFLFPLSTVLVELENKERRREEFLEYFFKYRLTGRVDGVQVVLLYFFQLNCSLLWHRINISAKKTSLCLPFVQLLDRSREKEFVACIKMFLISASHIRIAERREAWKRPDIRVMEINGQVGTQLGTFL